MSSLLKRAQLQLEALEERAVPSATSPDVDLSTRGAIGSVNGAIFRQVDAQPTGTGVIDSFVRLQAKGAGAQVEQGYNTGARPLQFDENTSPQFTRSLLLSDVPVVDLDGVSYREFLLDINQKASQPYLSMDAVKVFVGGAPNLTGYSGGQLAGLNAVFDLDAGGDHWVKLDSRLNQGSGKGDMMMYVPNSLFAGAGANSYLYLYSRFGDNFMSNAGFEEWAVSRGGSLTNTSGSISGNLVSDTGAPLVGVVVFLDANHNGVLDSNEIYTVTDASGHYAFDNLSVGLGAYSTYDVRILPPTDYVQQSPDAGLLVLSQVYQNVTNVNFVLQSPTSSTSVPPPPA